MSIAKRIIIEELIEDSHIEKVADVIYWALEKYASSEKTNGAIVAGSIISSIKEAEKKELLKQ